MPNDKLVLNVSKINISPDSTRLKYSQDERGKQVDITVISNDGSTAYDLSGKKIVFTEIKQGGKIIVDGSSDHFIRSPDNDKIGRFTYKLVDQSFQQSGEAHFELTTDIEHIDTTIDFYIEIISAAQLKPDNNSYISSLIDLEASYKSLIQRSSATVDATIKSFNDQIQKAINNGNQSLANQLNASKAKLQQIQNQENTLITSWTAEFNQRKGDFDKLRSDWQKQSKQISDSSTAQINKINSDARSQHDAIQAKADKQLKDNNSANSAAIAKIQNDAKAKLDGIEKAKNDAIAKVNSEKEAALQAADNSFKAKIAELQSNYDAWKSTALTDLNKQLQQIKSDIGSNKNELTDFQKKLDYTKTELENMAKQLDSLDFTKFVTGDQFKEAMSKKASGLKVMGLGGEYVMAVDPKDQNINAVPSGVQGLADIGVLSGALQVLADAILDKNHYTKNEVNRMVDDAKKQIMNSLNSKANANDLNGKADKTQIQSMSNQITSLQQEVAKNTPVHVKSVDDVAKQTAHIVIVDD